MSWRNFPIKFYPKGILLDCTAFSDLFVAFLALMINSNDIIVIYSNECNDIVRYKTSQTQDK